MKRFLPMLLLPAALALLLAAPGLRANPLWVGYFELLGQPYSLSLPAAGSQWEAFASSYIAGDGGFIVVQAEYDDNGDDLVSPGDNIWGPDGMARDRIIVAAATRLYRLVGRDWVLRPQLENPGGPVGETWEILVPESDWGTTLQVDDWTDFPPAGPSPGDEVQLDGAWFVVAQVSLCVEGTHGVPVEPTTWGKIKAFFGELF